MTTEKEDVWSKSASKTTKTEEEEEEIKEHKIEKDTKNPDFTPKKEKIKGPTHASSAHDNVTMGIASNEFSYTPYGKKS